MGDSTAALENPILNSPYDPPEQHFVIGLRGPTGEIRAGRRPSESFIPIPAGRKGRGKPGDDQPAIDFDVTGERREVNSLINDIRQRVKLWRARGYTGVTPITRKLLQHWADPSREDRVLFCQREAAETAIYLAEAAGRSGEPDFRVRVDAENVAHNDGLPRLGLKMATGSGKTVVMAMLIAWQVANKAFSPRDARFTKRFLVVTPGITIRDRLRVLLSADEENYYDLRGLVPADLRSTLDTASIVITNYHAFLPRTAKEVRGVAANTRKLLRAGKRMDPFVETDEQIVDRVLRDLAGRGRGELVVINDEAHHCYQDKPLGAGADTVVDREAKERNEGARIWFRGIAAVARRAGVKAIYDLSATPFYLGGSGYQEGYIFPWVGSDFGLMDAIESGIVKIPRLPVDDDATAIEQVSYLYLWDQVKDDVPKKAGAAATPDPTWVMPDALQGALMSLYRSYERRFRHWERELAPHGEPPPVFIVVCPNTVASRRMFDWIAGMEVPAGEDVHLRPGRLELLSNVVDGHWVDRQPTIIVDSAQLESGEALSKEFKAAAAHEIEAFKAEVRLRTPGADVDQLSDEDVLREVLNTVGKPGRLGERVRCVVSVAMLTEGWDANTVTHILGIRRFGSQLLCEQVVGRGLRRRSYEPNAQGRFEPEYADIYGVPFAFLPDGPSETERPPSRPAVEVRALPGRSALRIEFPKVAGYRVEVPEERIAFDHEHTAAIHVDRKAIATWTQVAGVVGAADDHELPEIRHARRQEVVFKVAAEVLARKFAGLDGALRPWLFPELLDVTQRWLDMRVSFAPDTPVGALLLDQPRARAAEAVYDAVVRYDGGEDRVLPMFHVDGGRGSTDDVSFLTRKALFEVDKSHVSHVVLDGPKGNTWEEILALRLELHPRVAAYVKNDRLDFTIPYVYEGRSHHYVPDFLARLVDEPGQPTRTLVIEVSGGQKSPGPTAVKAATARDQWCVAVNNDGTFGRWGYIEITEMEGVAAVLDLAINSLAAGEPIPAVVP